MPSLLPARCWASAALCLFVSVASAQAGVPAGPVPPWTPKDVLDARIDVQAQYALFRMLKGTPAQRVDASHMLSAVKSGALQGIYQENQKVPALRAQALGTWWGRILPRGVEGICMTEPASKPPVVAMRQGTPTDKARYDRSLAAARGQCLVLIAWPVRPYDPSAPGDPAATGAAQACLGAAGLAQALQECEDHKNLRMQRCEAQNQIILQSTVVQQPSGARCVTRATEFHAVCQQTAYAACR